MSVVERERVQTEVTVREVLHRAADLLEEFGWKQGGLWTGPLSDWGAYNATAFCAAGAVLRAHLDLGGESPRWCAYGQPDGHYETAQRYYGEPINDWNDEPGRTKAEVVTRLRQAAEAA